MGKKRRAPQSPCLPPPPVATHRPTHAASSVMHHTRSHAASLMRPLSSPLNGPHVLHVSTSPNASFFFFSKLSPNLFHAINFGVYSSLFYHWNSVTIVTNCYWNFSQKFFCDNYHRTITKLMWKLLLWKISVTNSVIKPNLTLLSPKCSVVKWVIFH